MRKENSLILRNSVPINTLRLAFAALGMIMLFTMPREQYPNVPLYYVHVIAPYPGATAFQVEKDITQKIEEALQGVEDITDASSLVSDGFSFTRIAFSQALSEQEFQNRYQNVQSLISDLSLPDGALKPTVQNFTYLDFVSIVNVVVSADLPPAQLIEYAKRVETSIKNAPGVLRVNNKGLFAKRIVVQLDENAVRARGIAPQEIENAIRAANATIPGGTLRTKSRQTPIQVLSGINAAEDVNNIVVRKTDAGTTLLSDIAVIAERYDNASQLVRFDGNPAVEFQVYKTGAADSISLVKTIEKRIAEQQASFGDAGVRVSLFADTTENIKNTISMLVSNAIAGFIMVFLSLLLFLGWRPAVICSLEIPFTFAVSFFILNLLGITLNSSTLFALVLVLGMVVDHSTVILENITRIQCEGEKDRVKAVMSGVRGVAFPVISSTLTTVGTFFPLIFMPGFIGKFLLPVPVTITVTMIISTISALITIPIHYIELPGKDSIREFTIFVRMRAWVGAGLEVILRFKLLVAGLVMAVIAGIIIMVFFVPVSLYDTEEQPFFFVDVTMPSGTSLELSNSVMREMENAVLSVADENGIRGVLTLIGNTDPDIAEGLRIDRPHNAQLQIAVTNPNAESKALPMDTVMRNVEAVLAPVAGPDSVRLRKLRSGPPQLPAIGYQLLGSDLDALESLDAEIRKKLESYDDLYNVRSNLQARTASLEVTVDGLKAAQYGLTLAQIGLAIRSFFAEDAISSLFVDNEQMDIVVTYGGSPVRAKQALTFLTFPSQNGSVVPFSAVATVQEKENLTSLSRKDGRRQVNISAEAYTREQVRSINAEITALANARIAESGSAVEFKIGGEFEEFSSLLTDVALLFVVGVLLVYMVLTLEFKSYFQPILIMMTILFTTIGVGAYLLITRTALSISILYSFVALVGVVVNNAIVLISMANQNLKEGMTHHRAIISAAQLRVKPIVLTSVTTIIGILPTALGLGGSSPIWQPMAATIATGLTISTLTSVFILPVFYEIFSWDKKHAPRPPAADAEVLIPSPPNISGPSKPAAPAAKPLASAKPSAAAVNNFNIFGQDAAAHNAAARGAQNVSPRAQKETVARGPQETVARVAQKQTGATQQKTAAAKMPAILAGLETRQEKQEKTSAARVAQPKTGATQQKNSHAAALFSAFDRDIIRSYAEKIKQIDEAANALFEIFGRGRELLFTGRAPKTSSGSQSQRNSAAKKAARAAASRIRGQQP